MADRIVLDVTPDHAGYVEAQRRLRELLGEAVVLLQPAVRTYDPGVALDPSTGQPFDPTIEATTFAQASASVQARIAFRGIPHRDDAAPVVDGALGFMENTDVVAIMDIGAASAASGAVSMIVRNEHYEIRAARTDGIVGVDRYLVFGAKDQA